VLDVSRERTDEVQPAVAKVLGARLEFATARRPRAGAAPRHPGAEVRGMSDRTFLDKPIVPAGVCIQNDAELM
jgi:hypothetical protein